MKHTALIVTGCIAFFILTVILSTTFFLAHTDPVQARNASMAGANFAAPTAQGQLAPATTFPKPQILTTVNLPLGIGDMPSVVTADPNSGYVYVGAEWDISIISGTQVIKMIEPHGYVTAMSVNPNTGLAYVAVSGPIPADMVKVISGTEVVATLPGEYTKAIAVNPKTGYVYVANYYRNSVTVISGTTTVTTLTVGTKPNAIGVNSNTGYVYVANEESDNITVLSGTQVITTFASTGPQPQVVTVNPDTGYGYIGTTSGVMVVSATHVITTVQTSLPSSIQINPVSELVYVGSAYYGTVTVISGTDYVDSISVAGAGAHSIGINPITGYIYVASNQDNNVTMISGTQVIATAAAGEKPCAVGVSPLSGYAYIANEYDNTVTIISGTTVIETLPPAPSSYAIDMNPVSRYVYVTNEGNDTITIISNTGIITTIPVDAWDVAVNPTTGYVYASTGYYEITVISDTQVITTIPRVGQGYPRDIAINPATGYVYVARQSSDAVNVISGTEVVTTVHIGTDPEEIAVNPTTGFVYVTNWGHNGMAIISGTEVITLVQTPNSSNLITVNPTTGLVYAAGITGSVYILSGTQLITTLPPAGGVPHAMGVNPTTGYVYLSLFDYYSSKTAGISIISGTQRVATLTLGTRPDVSGMGIVENAVGIDRSNGYVYVPDPTDNAVIVMKGTSVIGQISLDSAPGAMSVDPVTGYVYTVLRGQSIAILNTVLIDLPYQTYLPIVRRSGT